MREEAITEAIATTLQGVQIKPEILTWLRQALKESWVEEKSAQDVERLNLEKEAEGMRSRLHSLYQDKLDGVVPDIVYPGRKAEWEWKLASIDKRIALYSRAERSYFDEGVALLEFASNAYARFKEASFERKQEMARHLLSNSTITDGEIEINLHPGFKMILEANQEMEGNATKSRDLAKWLPAKDSNLD